MKVQPVKRSMAWVASLALVLAPVLTAKAAYGANDMITLDFRNVEISEFIKTVSKLTDRNFLVDQNVRGTVTIIGPKPVPVSEVWRIFHSVLEVKGLAVVKVGDLYKIIQRRDAKGTNIPVVVGSEPAYYTEEPVIQVVPLEFYDAKEAVEFLKNFAGKNAQIFSHEGTNTLIIVDDATNVVKLLELLTNLDSSEQEEVIEIVDVEHIGADSAAQLLNEIFKSEEGDNNRRRRRRSGDSSSSGVPARIVVDTRLNRLVFIGAQDEIDTMKDVLSELDVAEDMAASTAHVYYLEHADAETLAPTLNSLVTGQQQASSRGNKDGNQQQQQLSIVADNSNNAIIFITENTEQLKAATNLLEKLDIPRPQVYVEAAIIEIGLNDTKSFSLSGGAASETQLAGEDATVFAGQSLGGLSPLGIDPAAVSELQGLFTGAIVTPESGVLPPLGIILQAAASNSNTNVLSTPHLLTSDNEEAEIVVGDNVPFLTGQTATSGGNVISSIERRDVGITLRVTPTINESDQVRLELYQEISSVSSNAPSGLDVNQQGLTTSKRSAKTNVVVANGRTVAIGGLISEQENTSETKVPILGDIPIIGWLFKSYNTSKRKTNLIIFLTPHIVRNQDELGTVSRGYARQFRSINADFVSDQQDDFLETASEPFTYADTATTAAARFDREMVLEIDEDDIRAVPAEQPVTRAVPATDTATEAEAQVVIDEGTPPATDPVQTPPVVTPPPVTATEATAPTPLDESPTMVTVETAPATEPAAATAPTPATEATEAP